MGREGEKHQCMSDTPARLPLARPTTEDLVYYPGMGPNWELNQQTFGSQAGYQSTEPYQPEQKVKTY